MPRPKVTTLLSLTAAAGFGIAAALLAYHLTRAGITESVYRDRLEDIASRYESLRDQYNDAVRRTTITELIVTDNRLSVRIRDASGIIREIPTRYDPRNEIYVDYAIIDGRLWIRRVFDALTPPAEGTIIDPQLAGITWDGDRATFGKAVYRSLDEGRWVVAVSGDGSLGLGPALGPVNTLAMPPALGTFDEMNQQLKDDIANIGPSDIWREFWKD